MSRRAAPISIVSGPVKIFVNEPECLQHVLDVLDSQRKSADADHKVLSLAVQAQAAISGAIGKHCPSLKDGIFHCKGLISKKLQKQLIKLNTAHSYIKHFTPEGGVDTLTQLREALSSPAKRASVQEATKPLPCQAFDDPAAQEDLQFVGDWRPLPECEWKRIHGRFLRAPAAVAADLRTQTVSFLRGEPNATPTDRCLKFAELSSDAFADHFKALSPFHPRARSWDELRAAFPRFSQTLCYDKICDRFHYGSKDPRKKSDEFLELLVIVSDVWKSALCQVSREQAS